MPHRIPRRYAPLKDRPTTGRCRPSIPHRLIGAAGCKSVRVAAKRQSVHRTCVALGGPHVSLYVPHLVPLMLGLEVGQRDCLALANVSANRRWRRDSLKSGSSECTRRPPHPCARVGILRALRERAAARRGRVVNVILEHLERRIRFRGDGRSWLVKSATTSPALGPFAANRLDPAVVPPALHKIP